MRDLTLKPGDFFATQGKGLISTLINFFQRLWSKDNEARYTHCGLILDPKGTTLESTIKGTLDSQNLFETYSGIQIFISRYDKLTSELFKRSLEALEKEFGGEDYPLYRVLLHIFPPLARLHFLGRAVCSEVVAYYLWRIEARHRWWASTNPDTLSDEWHKWKDFTTVFEGIL
ncbi:MAG: hypothetical protein H8D67_16790 [Deltaproteobacteria bacterium]|nr:hypothetical protein [Deltaproteobacteria bacterium]